MAEDDNLNYVRYLREAAGFAEHLDMHHNIEEEVIFPFFIEKSRSTEQGNVVKENTEHLIAEHRDLVAWLHELQNLAKTSNPKKETIDKALELLIKIKNFIEPHFQQENQTLANRSYTAHIPDSAFRELFVRTGMM